MTTFKNTKIRTTIRNTFMALGLSAIALTTMAVTADAGGGHKKHRHFGHHWGHHHVYHGGYKFRGCYRFKRKFYHTGKKYWLNRYYECKWDR